MSSLSLIVETRSRMSVHFGGQPGDECDCADCQAVRALDELIAKHTPPPEPFVFECEAFEVMSEGQAFLNLDHPGLPKGKRFHVVATEIMGARP